MGNWMDVYQGAEYEVRLKARLFSAVLLILMGVYLLFCVMLVAFKTYNLSLAVFGLQIVLLGASWVFLRQGKYDLSASVTTPSLLFGLWLGNQAIPYSGDQTFPVAALGYATMFLIMTLFLRQRRLVIGSGVLILVLFLVQVGLAAPVLEERKANLVALTAGPLIFLGLILVLSITLQQVFHRISRDLAQQLEAIEASRKKTREVMGQVAASLDQSDELQANAAETAASTVEIEQNVLHIKERIQNLDASFGNTERSLEAINKSLESLTDLTQQQTAVAGTSSAAVEQMVASIQNVSGIIRHRSADVEALGQTSKEGQRAIAETGDSFRSVVRQIETIKEMTHIITDISAQTNLLAMNAAIEAAHAGNAGRGFSVVASEIRKLAESSSQSAGTIEQNLKDLMESMEKTGHRVDATGQAFDRMRQSVELVSGAMQEIAASTGEMNTGTDEILASTGRLSTATKGVETSAAEVNRAYRQILTNVRQVSEVITEVASGMEEIGIGTSDIRKAVAEVTRLSQALKDQTQRLSAAAAE